MRVVFDPSVLDAAGHSRQGANYALVSSIPAPEFQPCLSVGLYSEWLEVLTRPEHLTPGGTAEDARRFGRYLASQSHLQEIHFRWRPFLPDPDDDLVLELAFAAILSPITPVLPACGGRKFFALDRNPPPPVKTGSRIVLLGDQGMFRFSNDKGLALGVTIYAVEASSGDGLRFRFHSDISKAMTFLALPPAQTPESSPHGGISGRPKLQPLPPRWSRHGKIVNIQDRLSPARQTAPLRMQRGGLTTDVKSSTTAWD